MPTNLALWIGVVRMCVCYSVGLGWRPGGVNALSLHYSALV